MYLQKLHTPLFKCGVIFLSAMLLSSCGSESNSSSKGNGANTDQTTLTDKSNQVAFTLEVMHLNDVHSFLKPQNMSFYSQQGRLDVLTGGGSAIVSVVADHREKNHDLLLVSAGDQYSGNLTNYLTYRGLSDAVLYGALGLDFYTLGIHEFDYGDSGISKFIEFMQKKSPKSKLVVSNLDFEKINITKNIQPYIHKSYVKKLDNWDVGVVGFTDGNKIQLSSKPNEGMNFSDEETLIDNLEELHTPIKVLLLHYNVEESKKIASLLPDIDVIVSGGGHDLCGDFSRVGIKTECPYPVVMKNASGKNVCIVSAYEHGKGIGDLLVDFNANGEVLNCRGNMIIPIHKNTAQFFPNEDLDKEQANSDKNKLSDNSDDDSLILPKLDKYSMYDYLDELIFDDYQFVTAVHDEVFDTTIEPYIEKIAKIYSKKIGESKDDYCSNALPNTSCHIKNKVTTNGSEVCQIFTKMIKIRTGADVVLYNSSSFRTDLPKGDVSREILEKVYPFRNDMVEVLMSGSELIYFLNKTVDNLIKSPDLSLNAFPCGSGLTFTYDENGTVEDQSIIKDIQIVNKKSGSSKVRKDKVYKVIVSSYLKSGAEGYDLLKNFDVNKNYGQDMSLFKDFLEKNKRFPTLDAKFMMLHKYVPKIVEPVVEPVVENVEDKQTTDSNSTIKETSNTEKKLDHKLESKEASTETPETKVKVDSKSVDEISNSNATNNVNDANDNNVNTIRSDSNETSKPQENTKLGTQESSNNNSNDVSNGESKDNSKVKKDVVGDIIMSSPIH